ncbi:MAG TPA: DUF4229 domain-containing protein [Dermatophilaceae bacterium]|nr:DUF4229 domain-containing protein [Dermatophilaceae bacterium]
MSAVIRYSLMRVLVFLGVLCLLWLAGLRGEGNRLLLFALSLLVSMGVSFFVLRPFREDMSAKIAAKVEARSRRLEERRADEAEQE